MKVTCHGVGVLNALQCLLGSGVVLVQQLGQGGAVASRFLQLIGRGGVVTTCNVEIAEHIVEAIGVDSVRQETLGLVELTLREAHQSLVGIRLLCLGVYTKGLGYVLLGGGIVALVERQGSQIVVSPVVLIVEFGGLLINFGLLVGVVFQRGSVENLLYIELGGVGGVLLLDLLIGASDGLVVDNATGTAQLRQHLIGQVTEAFAHIANLLLTFLRVLVHRQHAKNHVLVLHVAGLDELLEAFPVLRGVMRVDVGLHLDVLELRFHVLLAVVLTLAGQLVIEAEATFGRRIGCHLDILDGQSLSVGIDTLEHSDKFLHAVVLQLALAQVGLIDEELHIGFLLLGVDTLERVGSDARSAIHHRATVKL